MLIYARLMLASAILSSIITIFVLIIIMIVGHVINEGGGGTAKLGASGYALTVGGLLLNSALIWIAVLNFSEANKCANPGSPGSPGSP
jgi:hypothetical protein